MTLKTLLADDESLARKRLRQLLAIDPDIEIVEECRNGDEVIASLKANPIDLVFLDIQMPGNTGFEVIDAIGSARMPITVFVTAHANYAVQAFDAHALDYLIKPIDEERLRVTLAHVKKRIAADSALTVQTQLNGLLQNINGITSGSRAYPQRLLITDGSEDSFVAVNEIECIEAADDYACIHVGSKTMMPRQTIRQLAESLDPMNFVRVHRSAIVNIDYVRKILREGRTDGWLLLTSGKRIRMSKTGWQSLLAVMSPEAS
ncbi:MAG: response regulator receiver protein [Edaphobacter sp.]|nr:response regulator receiver protein [Edaphobacter sp.]